VPLSSSPMQGEARVIRSAPLSIPQTHKWFIYHPGWTGGLRVLRSSLPPVTTSSRVASTRACRDAGARLGWCFPPAPSIKMSNESTFFPLCECGYENSDSAGEAAATGARFTDLQDLSHLRHPECR
jgi:hypothetical protein